MKNFIKEYYDSIHDGSICVGKWIRMLYEYIIRGIECGCFAFNQKKANKAVRFIETFCHHSEGRNDILKLELWEKAMISVVFGIVDENDVRIFREIFIVIARKNGKTLLVAAITAYCVYLDGEYGAKVFFVAPKLDQADLAYSAFKQIVEQDSELSEMTRARKSDLYIERTNSSVKKIAFNAQKSDGFNPHLTVCDEIASWPAAQGLKQYEVMKSAQGARKQPLIISITTSGYVNDGIYDELFKRSTRFLRGDSRERRLCPFLYTIDDIEKWNDIGELKKSNPNLGVSVSEDYLIEEIAIAEKSLSKRAEFFTKYCNIKQNSSQAWLDAPMVEKAFSETAFDIEKFRDSYCVGGVDLSKTTDLTCCVAVIEKEKKLHVLAQFYMPTEKLEEATARDGIPYAAYVKQGILKLSGDNFVDYHDCMQFFTSLVEEYQIYPLKIGYDRYSAQYLVQDMKTYGFHMDDVFQGTNLTPVIREFEGYIKDGAFNMGKNDLLKMHLLNAALKIDAEDQRVKLIKIAKTERIDGAAALLDAMCVRQKWHDEIGEQIKNEEE